MSEYDHLRFIMDHSTLGTSNLDMSSRCTLKCSSCARAALQGSKSDRKYIKNRIKNGKDVELESMRKIFEFFPRVGICGQISDPVFHPKLLEILEMRKSEYPDTDLTIHTAAHQKNIEWYRKAFELTDTRRTMWIFGLDGLEDTSMIYREGQNSPLVMEAMKLGASMGVDVHWQYILFDYNLHQVEQAKEIAAEHGIQLEFMQTNRPSKNPNIKVPDEYLSKNEKRIIKL